MKTNIKVPLSISIHQFQAGHKKTKLGSSLSVVSIYQPILAIFQLLSLDFSLLHGLFFDFYISLDLCSRFNFTLSFNVTINTTILFCSFLLFFLIRCSHSYFCTFIFVFRYFLYILIFFQTTVFLKTTQIYQIYDSRIFYL